MRIIVGVALMVKKLGTWFAWIVLENVNKSFKRNEIVDGFIVLRVVLNKCRNGKSKVADDLNKLCRPFAKVTQVIFPLIVMAEKR